MSASAAKLRKLSELAAAQSVVVEAEEAWKRAVEQRNAKGQAAQKAGGSYRELGEATGLSKVGVYKMLERANGGKLAG